MDDKRITYPTKYNYGEPIPLDSIPIEECEQALIEFAAGSPALEKCIREMWMHGLKTYCCYNGEQNSFDIGYIIMEEGEDIFIYLSPDFIYDERIRIDLVDNKQRVRFAGSNPEKEGAMLFLTREIQSGRKKNNGEAILENIGKPYPNGWVRRLKSYNGNPDSTYWSERVLIMRKTPPDNNKK